MKKGIFILAGAALAMLPLVVASAREDEKQAALPTEITCAVMPDHKVNVAEATKKGMFADYEYGRYYFCCAGCPPAFKKEPEKFTKNASLALTKLPMPKEIACAVMTDHKVNIAEATEKSMFADFNGTRYYFCCAGCPPAFKSEPEKFTKNAGISIGMLPLPKEGKCAVSGAKIVVADALAKKNFADYHGRRYLFCCENCPKAFKNDPEKFAKNASVPSPKKADKKTDA